MKNSLVFLMGPTASGKTQIAVELVRRFPFEIISVDSALIYRGMDIGTAKPDKKILAMAPHHLIDIRDPSETYSAAQFREDALHLIKDIQFRQKIPLFVGGTMLYFRALQKGLAAMPAADVLVRAQLSQEAQEKGWEKLHERLAEIDPITAARIHRNDPQRIQRALEVYILSGKTMTDWQKEQEINEMTDPIHHLIVAPHERSRLHQRIAERFKQMLAAGFMDEVRQLYARDDLNLDLPSMRSVGYRQVWQYLNGEYSYEAMEEKAIIATRQLAKRQLTWLRSWPNGVWFDSEEDGCFNQIVDYLINKEVVS
jgi:tRNA dimethylallyltransferase